MILFALAAYVVHMHTLLLSEILDKFLSTWRAVSVVFVWYVIAGWLPCGKLCRGVSTESSAGNATEWSSCVPQDSSECHGGAHQQRLCRLCQSLYQPRMLLSLCVIIVMQSASTKSFTNIWLWNMNSLLCVNFKLTHWPPARLLPTCQPRHWRVLQL